MPKLFGVTLFLSATLLFLVQPMIGKMVLPLVGGTPAVWNTCMVFFQGLLLAGYYYAHKSTSKLPPARQVFVHGGLLLATGGALATGAALIANHSPVPIVKSLAPQGSSLPFFGVIGLLTIAIGLPFFTVATTAPLLQKWFSETGHPSAKDPYFLYAASNLGSLLALVAYPFLVEPSLRLVNQAWLWAAGFIGLAAMIVACGRAIRSAGPSSRTDPKPSSPPVAAGPRPSDRLRWLFLAGVPSSLMLAVGTDLTTDIVSMPLLWIVPLALYLLTFIIAFSKWVPRQVHLYVTLMTPVLILLLVFLRASRNVSASSLDISFKLMLGLELLTFFLVALTCHGELARTRPPAEHLTEFYLIMSVGGVLGGLFNALVAPVAFTFITEFPLTIVAACCLLPPIRHLLNPDGERAPRFFTVWDFVLPLLFFATARYLSAYYPDLVATCRSLMDETGIRPRLRGRPMDARMVATIIAFGLPALFCYFVVERPLRFGACVGALWVGTFLTFYLNDRKTDPEYRTAYARSFFGLMKVEKNPRETRLVHGTTVHGAQWREDIDHEHSITAALGLVGANTPADALALAWIAQPHLEYPGREPLTYYHRTGPVGVMFDAVRSQRPPGSPPADVACIGLGTGTLSAYGRPGQRMTFFEIDQTVRDLVEEPRHFAYIDRARKQGTEIEFIMGDARLSLEQTDRRWDFMLVDAFSSDAIPAHLLTREAVRLYFDRLTEDGLLALHISNRYLNLEPVVERIVRELGYAAVVMHDVLASDYEASQDELSGKLSSTWVAVARRPEDLGPLRTDPRWKPLTRDDRVGLWTDDYTPIRSVLQGEWDLFGD